MLRINPSAGYHKQSCKLVVLFRGFEGAIAPPQRQEHFGHVTSEQMSLLSLLDIYYDSELCFLSHSHETFMIFICL
jgi:hypothetical protein